MEKERKRSPHRLGVKLATGRIIFSSSTIGKAIVETNNKSDFDYTKEE